MLEETESSSRGPSPVTCLLCLRPSLLGRFPVAKGPPGPPGSSRIGSVKASNCGCAYSENTRKHVDFLTTASAPLLAPLAEHERVCMTRRPPEAERRVEKNMPAPTTLMGHKVCPNPTLQKATHSKWKPQRTPQQSQPETRTSKQSFRKQIMCL